MSGDALAGITDCGAALNRAPDPTSRAYSQGFLAYSFLEQGDVARALPQLEQASEEISRIGFRPFVALFLAYLSEALRAARNAERAMQAAREGIEAAKRFRYPFGEAWAHRALGRALVAAARVDEGYREIAAAAEMFQAMGSQYETDRCQRQLIGPISI
jgi:tetratricopeptide (TPR) repeat protein